MNTQKIPSLFEFREVLTHEYGHIIDLGVIKGNSSRRNSNFTEFGKIQRSIDDPSLDFYQISRDGEDIRKQ